jgi:hypothetical protein
MLKNPAGMKRDACRQKFTTISCQVSPASLLGVSGGYCQKALVDASGMTGTQMGTYNRSEMVAVYGMPCVIPPCNSNSNMFTKEPVTISVL